MKYGFFIRVSMSMEARISLSTAQLCNHYGLITSVASGMTDAKIMDAQAGYEKAVTTTAAVLAGGNLVAAYPGIVGSLIGQSFEGMIIDNDMLGCIQRLLRGIEVTEETLSLEVIRDTVSGAGHYLNHPQTLALMRSEFLYPELGDRTTPGTWEEYGHRTILDQAHERVHALLHDYFPRYIDKRADGRIRSAFPIRLETAAMQPGNGRW